MGRVFVDSARKRTWFTGRVLYTPAVHLGQTELLLGP